MFLADLKYWIKFTAASIRIFSFVDARSQKYDSKGFSDMILFLKTFLQILECFSQQTHVFNARAWWRSAVIEILHVSQAHVEIVDQTSRDK